MTQGYRRYSARESRFSTPARHVRMAVDESGHQASPFEIDHRSAGYFEIIVTQRKNSSATDQQLAYAQVLGREDIGVLD